MAADRTMSTGFQRVLDHIRAISDTEAEKGRLFERLMKAYFLQDAVYRNRFSNVWLWSEWAATRPDFDAVDTGVDLVAEEREGGYCAIQCKCYAPGTRMSRKHVDTFVTASARQPFTARIVVDTGDEWGPNAATAILAVQPGVFVPPLNLGEDAILNMLRIRLPDELFLATSPFGSGRDAMLELVKHDDIRHDWVIRKTTLCLLFRSSFLRNCCHRRS